MSFESVALPLLYEHAGDVAEHSDRSAADGALARVGLDMHSQAQQGRPWFGLRDVGFSLSGEPVTTPVSDWSFASRANGVRASPILKLP